MPIRGVAPEHFGLSRRPIDKPEFLTVAFASPRPVTAFRHNFPSLLSQFMFN